MDSLENSTGPENSAKFRDIYPVVDPCGKRTVMDWVLERKTDLSFLKKETNYYSALIRFSDISEKIQAKQILLQFEDLVHIELPKMVETVSQVEKHLSVIDDQPSAFNKQNLSAIQKHWSDFKAKYVATKFELLDAITHHYPVRII